MIDQRLAAFAGVRAQTLAGVAPLRQPQLDFRPREGSWSIGEIADHLILAEALYRGEITRLIAMVQNGERPYLKRSFADVNVSPLYLPDVMLSFLEVPFGMMSRMIPESVRSVVTQFPIVPIRNPDVATPRFGRPAAELREDLTNSLARTRALIEEHATLDFTRMVSEHPLTGAANVEQIFGFLTLHERRHHVQMERVRINPRFPAASS
ncbi:MAG TPA: DinB family protein [Vicinamibacterales bacterium]